MENDYRFLKTKDGITYFAHVWTLFDRNGDLGVFDGISKVDPNLGEIDSLMEPTWVAAAIEGVRKVVNRLSESGKYTGGAVYITKIIGSVLDTRDDVVMCAAAIASWKTINPESIPPEFEMKEGRWIIKFNE